MKISPEITIKPFGVPSVVSEYPVTAAPAAPAAVAPTLGDVVPIRRFALSELTSETLEALCEDFTHSVFEKAGKERPVYLHGTRIIFDGDDAPLGRVNTQDAFNAIVTSGCGDECWGGGCDRRQKESKLTMGYRDRLVREKSELDERREHLFGFMYSEDFKALSTQDKNLLDNQYDAMTQYSAHLGNRIKRLK